MAAPGARAEDDGVVLSVVLDAAAGRSFLLVLDASGFEELVRRRRTAYHSASTATSPERSPDMCGHRNRYRSGRRFLGADDSGLRTSQEERDRMVSLLQRHAGEGRLDLEELEQRVEAALGARTRGQLAALTADLPDLERAQRRRRTVRRVALGSFASAMLPLLAGIAIIALAPPAFEWVGWTAIGWWFFAGLPSAGIGFAWCGHARRRRARDTVVV